MRLKGKLETLAIALGIELIILIVIGMVIFFQFDRAKTEFVTKTRAIAETIGEQASSFFTLRGEGSTSDEFFMYLDERLGRKKLFNTFEIAPEFFSVVLKKDIEGRKTSGYFMKDFQPTAGYSVRKDKGMISVSVPFTLREQSEPFGIIKIDSNARTLLDKVVRDNFLIYMVILIILNNQAFFLYLFMRRKKEVVFEKGYLRENSIGSLKIMHKLLGDMIQDHEKMPPSSEPGKKGDGKKVISISELIEKRKQ